MSTVYSGSEYTAVIYSSIWLFLFSFTQFYKIQNDSCVKNRPAPVMRCPNSDSDLYCALRVLNPVFAYVP